MVKAFDGPLPIRIRGIEWKTKTVPDPGPPGGGFMGGIGWSPKPGVRLDGEFAKMKVEITKNTQTMELPKSSDAMTMTGTK